MNVSIIQNIHSSNAFDPHTGFALIDDDSIPKWLLSKHKKDYVESDKEGNVVQAWKKGDIMYSSEGKPYLSLKAMISLCMGAIRQLDNRIKTLENIEK